VSQGRVVDLIGEGVRVEFWIPSRFGAPPSPDTPVATPESTPDKAVAGAVPCPILPFQLLTR
jgi:hypothetical protein